jgi:hypothetical protein
VRRVLVDTLEEPEFPKGEGWGRTGSVDEGSIWTSRSWRFGFQLLFEKVRVETNSQFLDESQGSWFPHRGDLVLDLLFQSSVKLVVESGIFPTQILTFGLEFGHVVGDWGELTEGDYLSFGSSGEVGVSGDLCGCIGEGLPWFEFRENVGVFDRDIAGPLLHQRLKPGKCGSLQSGTDVE